MVIASTYGQTSQGALREDVLDVIYQITPEDTPFFNMIGDTDASSPHHQWTTRDITVRNVNAVQEGAAFTFDDIQQPSRVTNLTQIFRKLPRVARSRQSSTNIGISDLMADQIQQAAVGLKTDIEHALLRGSAITGTSDDATVRTLGGFANVVTGNVFDYNNSLGTINESRFNDLLEAIWVDGGKAQDVLVNAKLKRLISTFTASSTKFFMQDDRRVINTIGVYESDFHVTNVHLSRDLRNVKVGTAGISGFDLFAFDRSFFAKAWLDRPIVERLPKIADAMDALLIAECTLEYGNQNAAGAFLQVSDSGL